jgi:TraM recognition site of TraD and TraG
MQTVYTMDSPVITFSDNEGNVQMSWDVWRAVEGTMIFGATGSGKTSGSATTIALKGLAMGFGGLVLTTKESEKQMWVEYCRHTRRSHDLAIIEPGGDYFFNFLQYEATDKSNSKSYTENIVRVLKTVIQAGEEKSSGKSDDPFWESSLDMLLYNTIELNMLAFGKLSVQGMYNIVLSAPRPDNDTGDQDGDDTATFAHAMRMAKENVQKLVEQFHDRLGDEEKKRLSTPALIDEAITEAIPEAARLKAVIQFFNQHYLNLSEKTRSIVDFSFSGFLFRLLKDPAYSLFCKNPSNITPENSLEGKIILINLPVKLYEKVGRDCQTMFKYIWQRAVERRDIRKNGLPVFLWADEAQNFFHSYDADFQTTARSSRVATVYMSQNLPTCYAFMGGQRFKERINSLLGNLGTKFFHANSDTETNRYASELIGDAYHREVSKSFTLSGHYSSSENNSDRLRRRVRPEEFVALRTGGYKNNHYVEAYMIVQGKGFANGLNHRKVTFKQNDITSP